MADASETMGAWETATVSTPSRSSRLARRPLSPVRERPEESDERDRVTAASGHGDLPDEQGIANTPAENGSDPKIATGPAESDPNESSSSPKTATDLAEIPSESKRDATDSGLDCLTASRKQSESEVDEAGHKSWPTESGIYDPSLFLDPKIGKHGRIANGSGPPKTLPTHHVAERAVMSGERQPRKQSGQGASAANEQLPPPQLPKEPRRQKRARAHRTSDQRHFHPSRWT